MSHGPFSSIISKQAIWLGPTIHDEMEVYSCPLSPFTKQTNQQTNKKLHNPHMPSLIDFLEKTVQGKGLMAGCLEHCNKYHIW